MKVLNYLILLSPLFTTGVSTPDDAILAQRFLREETPVRRRRLQETTASERVCFDVEYANGAITVALAPMESQEEPTPDPTACMEGATQVYEDGAWITIPCPYSCSPGCTGVYVHQTTTANNGGCTSSCVTAAELMNNTNYMCGLCPFT